MGYFLQSYPYLIESLALLLLAVAMIASMRKQRAVLLAAGVLCVPHAAFAMLHVPAFWQPDVIFHFLISPEDVVWAFSVGVIACWLAITPFARRLTYDIQWPALVRRYLLIGVVGALGFAVGWQWLSAPRFVMWATLFPAAFVAPLVLFLRPHLWPIAICGAFGFMLFHVADIYAFTHLWTQTRAYYNPIAQLPFDILEVPGFEWLVPLVFGFSWPLAVGYMCDVGWRDGPVLNASPARQGGITSPISGSLR
jgi:hypothetical protein